MVNGDDTPITRQPCPHEEKLLVRQPKDEPTAARIREVACRYPRWRPSEVREYIHGQDGIDIDVAVVNYVLAAMKICDVARNHPLWDPSAILKHVRGCGFNVDEPVVNNALRGCDPPIQRR